MAENMTFWYVCTLYISLLYMFLSKRDCFELQVPVVRRGGTVDNPQSYAKYVHSVLAGRAIMDDSEKKGFRLWYLWADNAENSLYLQLIIV